MRHRYPFEALQWLRRQRVDREAAALSECASQTARARVEEQRAQTARQNAEQQADELSCAERARLDEGTLRVGDLARVGDWRKGAQIELLAMAAREQRAGEALRSDVAAEAAARRALGVASSEAELIDTHRIDWQREREAARERAEEEASVEQWTAKRYSPRG